MRTLERSMVTLQSKSPRSWPLSSLVLAFNGRGRIRSLKDALSCFALPNQALESSLRENSKAHRKRFCDRETPADASTRALKKTKQAHWQRKPASQAAKHLDAPPANFSRTRTQRCAHPLRPNNPQWGLLRRHARA